MTPVSDKPKFCYVYILQSKKSNQWYTGCTTDLWKSFREHNDGKFKSWTKNLSIILYGTLRNLLGPHHHVDGELPAVSPEWFQPWHGPKYVCSNIPDLATKWGMDGQCSTLWRDNYCVISFGDIGKVSIKTLGH